MGLRYPYTPFFAAASLYFVWRALVSDRALLGESLQVTLGKRA